MIDIHCLDEMSRKVVIVEILQLQTYVLIASLRSL